MRTRTGAGVIAVLLSMALVFGGCSGATKGAAIGGIAGAATGAVVGEGKGAVIGGAVGAAAGAIIGDYMARQKEELDKVPGADVKQVGEELVVTFDSPILFDTDSSVLKSESMRMLDDVARVLVDYPDTDVLIKGHTDNTGSEAHNQSLSERRARAVENYLATRGVSIARLRSMGFGESLPVASNSDDYGRSQNRRVELQIAANESLKARAEDGSGRSR
ncbi:MAG: OmpA family protein [Candidatus Latescibacterota bacterium]|nr:MAG: OmpA family protein [Candidatus Latescibacterota bacterium]